MSNTTSPLFWQMDTEPAIVLCEGCALTATNMASEISNFAKFETMNEAHAILGALAALAGVDFGLTSSEVGMCDQCGVGSE